MQAAAQVETIDEAVASLGSQKLYSILPDGSWEYNGVGFTELQKQIWIWREIQKCEQNVKYFASHYCCSENAHLDDDTGIPPQIELLPFGISGKTGRRWDFVDAFFDAWQNPHDTVIEKSRDMMCSWLSMAGVLHDVMFRRNWATMTLSRVETLVDDGGEASSTDSLHGKVRFMYERLPDFLRRGIPLQFRYLRILNPITNSHVTGFSATPNAGRGPKWKRAVLDEFAHVPWSEQVMTSVSRACPHGKYLVSTPNGKANAFYRIRECARSIWPTLEHKRAHWRRLTIHWSQHPERGEAWYDDQITSQSMTAEAVAQELDISYTRSIGRRVYPRFVAEKHVAGGSLSIMRKVVYEPNRPIYMTWDFNHDPLLVEIIQMHATHPRFRVIGEICRRNAVYDDAILEFVFRFGSHEVVEKLIAENDGFAKAYGLNGQCEAGPLGHRVDLVICGDATEEKSTVNNKVPIYQRIVSSLRGFGFKVSRRVPLANPPIRLRIETVNDALGKNYVIMSPAALQLKKDFEEGSWDTADKDMRQSEDNDGTGLTRSHASSAFGYFLTQFHRPMTSVARVHQAPPRSQKELMQTVVRGW